MKSKIFALLALAALPLAVAAQDRGIDADIRENPDMGTPEADSTVAHSRYPFINLSANHIDLNGADWSAVSQKIKTPFDVTTIVLLGDSHIQAEGSTTPTRLSLQKRYGNAGRGLVIPFKIAGTNQPFDYTISTTAPVTSAKLLGKRPWVSPMGFTGISLHPDAQRYSFTVSVKEKDPQVPVDFSRVNVYFLDNAPTITAVKESASGRPLDYQVNTSDAFVALTLSEAVPGVTIDFDGGGNTEILGFELLNEMAGVNFSAIGNNGATYVAYNGVPDMGAGLASMNPDLVIISMGGNESFGNISDAQFYNSIDRLVNDITSHAPGVSILLTTPNECQKRVGGKGTAYRPNADSKRLRDQILKYGREHGVATYDFFEVAGGEGASTHWLNAKIMRDDRVHHSWDGYTLMGDLLYDALVEIFEQ